MTVVDFFLTFFDDFEFLDFSEKGYWARCFGKRFGSSGGDSFRVACIATLLSQSSGGASQRYAGHIL